MLEFLACSLITILPDFLVRRYLQGKRLGHEINLFTVWYELRWGITACAILTIVLLAAIFFYHPTTSNVSNLFRTVSVLPEEGGRVKEVYTRNNSFVRAGEPLFKLDDSVELAEVYTATKRLSEVDANILGSKSSLSAAIAREQEAHGILAQARNELKRGRDLYKRNPDAITLQKLDSLQNHLVSKEGAFKAAVAERDLADVTLNTTLPATRNRVVAELEEAEARLAKKTVYAGFSGTLEQFLLEPGDITSPILRPAGIIVPETSGRGKFIAGFRQITAPVLKKGMFAEIACSSKPFKIIPMYIEEIQDVIPSGQFRPGDRLVDPLDLAKPGTILVTLNELYEGDTVDIPPGSKCIANAYTDSHDLIATGELSGAGEIYFHAVDTLGVVHAILLRLQALILPVQILVLSGH
ncbi:MAG: HlyD family secretion protein [Roseibium sp.]